MSFESDTLPRLIIAAARRAFEAFDTDGATAALNHYLTLPEEHQADKAAVVALLEQVQSGELDTRRNAARALAEAAALVAERKAKKHAHRQKLRVYSRELIFLLKEPRPMSQTDMRRRLGIGDAWAWQRVLRMAMDTLGYRVRGLPNSEVVAAMRDYQDRQRRNAATPTD